MLPAIAIRDETTSGQVLNEWSRGTQVSFLRLTLLVGG